MFANRIQCSNIDWSRGFVGRLRLLTYRNPCAPISKHLILFATCRNCYKKVFAYELLIQAKLDCTQTRSHDHSIVFAQTQHRSSWIARLRGALSSVTSCCWKTIRRNYGKLGLVISVLDKIILEDIFISSMTQDKSI